MNAVDMVVDKILYKKIDTETSDTHLIKTFIGTATAVTTEVEIGTFLYKVGGKARIYARGYNLDSGMTLTINIYDGNDIIATQSDYASTQANAEINFEQSIQACKKYTVKAKITSTINNGKVAMAYVETYLHDNTEMYLI